MRLSDSVLESVKKIKSLSADYHYIYIDNGEWDGCAKLHCGCYYITIDNVKFYFFIKIANKVNNLIISLTGGAGGSDRSSGPYYNRWSYYVNSENSFLCIDDPMIWEYGVHHGWFYGTKTVSYAELASKLIKMVSKSLGLSNQDLAFFSSSSGGTASIVASNYLPGCKVMVINPQIVLSNDPYSKVIEEKTGLSFKGPDKYKRNNLISIIQKNKNNLYYLIINLASKWDYEENFIPFCNLMKIVPEFGINQYGNLVTWVYYAPLSQPHGAQEWKNLFPVLEYLLCEVNDLSILPLPLITFINSIWDEHYESQKKIHQASLSWSSEINIDELERINESFKQFGDYSYCFLLGELYLTGSDTMMDKKRALGYYREASENGEERAIIPYLKLLWDNKDSASKNELNRVVPDYISRGNKYAYGIYGLMAYHGYLGVVNYFDVVEYLKNSVKKYSEFGQAYVDSAIKTNDVKIIQDAMEYCKLHVLEYDFAGKLADYYYSGKYSERNLNKALEYALLAQKVKITWADNLLFDIYWELKNHDDEMISVVKNNIAKGNPGAFQRLGRAYYYGRGVQKDIDLAISNMLISIDKGVEWARIELFDMLWNYPDKSMDSLLSTLLTPLGDDNPSVSMRLQKMKKANRGI